MGQRISSNQPIATVIDNYVAELPAVQYERRFLKTIKANYTDEGPVIIKIFIKPEVAESFDAIVANTEDESARLLEAPNAVPYARVIQTERAIYMLRPFMPYSLYDRISTRPFFNLVERKWIAFQLLQGLHVVHTNQICHGDIKSENILVTHWNWAMISDFASFKPVYLPEDDPADFAYFFDSSSRRTCYVAPERFVSISEVRSNTLSQRLSPSMDIFSLGCVLAELFLEGTVIFSLSQLLKYKKGQYSPQLALDKIEDEGIRSMLAHMIQLDPSKRFSASEYLSEWSHCFPDFFGDFLFEYMRNVIDITLSGIGESEADARISRIYLDFDMLSAGLSLGAAMPDTTVGVDSFFCSVNMPIEVLFREHHIWNENGTLLISLVSHCVRHASYPTSRVRAIDLLLALGMTVADYYKLDMVLPFLLYLLADHCPIVRSSALKGLTYLVSIIEELPAADVDLFPEYIVPYLKPLVRDSSELVRFTYAKCLGPLIETAHKFLELSQLKYSDEFIKDAEPESGVALNSYDNRLNELRDLFQDHVTTFLVDPSEQVKRALLSDMTGLCMFFGRQKANDLLLSHMITYLNAHDWHLRSAFFESLVGVGTYIGSKSLEELLLPLIIQSLSDPEFKVVERVIDSLCSLTELGFFKKMKLRELIVQILPLSFHPRESVRISLAKLLSTCSQKLSALEREVYLSPVIQDILIEEVSIREQRPSYLIQYFKPPLSVDALDKALELLYMQPRVLPRMLQEGKKIEELLSGFGNFSKEEIEKLVKILPLVSSRSARKQEARFEPDMIDFRPSPHTIFLYPPDSPRVENSSIIVQEESEDLEAIVTLPKSVSSLSLTRLMPTDMKSVGRSSPTTSVTSATVAKPVSSHNAEHVFQREFISVENSSNTAKPLSDSVEGYLSSVVNEVARKSRLVFPPDVPEIGLRKDARHNRAASKERAKLDTRWRPSGFLVASFTEHSAAISQLAISADNSFFASASDDGTVKIWDCTRLDKNITNHSRLTYAHDGKFTSLAFCENRESVAVCSDKSYVDLFRIEVQPTSTGLSRYSKGILGRRCQLKDEFGVFVDHYDSDSQSVLVVGTNKGSLYGWDLRCSRFAWRMQNPLHHGMLSSMALDKTNSRSWIATGTFQGVLTCWDVRFQIPLRSVLLPTSSCIRKINSYQDASGVVEDKRILVASGQNEVSCWDIEQMRCTEVFCGRTLEDKIGKYVKSWSPGEVPNQYDALWKTRGLTSTLKLPECFTFAQYKDSIVTAGTDKMIRFWDLLNIEKSFVINGPQEQVDRHYSSYRVNNVVLHYERTFPTSSSLEGRRSSTNSAKTGLNLSKLRSEVSDSRNNHLDTINDVIISEQPFQVVISGSQDGIIKVFK